MASPILTIRQEKVSVHSKTDPLVFQATSWYAQDVDCKDIDGEDGFGDYNKYIIKAFGVTKEGYSVSASITGFTPYFYVRIPETWGSREIDAFREAILEKMPKAQQRNLILPIRVIRKKDFWGFTNFEDFKFIRLCFNNVKAMKSVVYQLAKPLQISRISHKPQKYTCYESNIDPYIRFIHINNLEPSGWLSLPAGTYQTSPDTLPTNAQIDVQVKWQDVQPHHSDQNARIIVCSFDLECMSDTGDFPVPKKDYKKLAFDLTETYNMIAKDFPSDNYNQVESIKACLLDTFNMFEDPDGKYTKYTSNVHKVQTKSDQYNHTRVKNMLISLVDDVYNTLSNPTYKHEEKVSLINIRLSSESANLPPLKGDEIIQIGSTFHMYGDKEVTYKNIITLGGCNPIEGADVITCKTEADLLIQWKNLIQKINPDIMTGYNIFGFDMWYLYERARDLGIESEFMCIGRLNESRCNYKENKLSSSALGDNILKFIDMEGRVLIDMMKVVQRDHKLDSYKLDAVASHFMKQNKHDVSPKDIFRLQRGSDEDRKIVADYCLQDCSLCNYLMMKLEILANNMGMSNVCLVPLSFIFMRGQGIKIFSLVLKQCKDEGFLIPVVKGAWSENAPEEDDEGYEGAIVLEPKEGIYIDDPVSVLDYASLYPSSMISENLSHDCYVEKGGKYDNLPGMEYLDISYDLYEGVGDKKKKNGERVCRFAQLPNGEKGIIPRILMKLLGARKATRKKMEWQVVKTKDGQEHKGFVNKGEHVTKVKLVEDNMREETVLNEEIDTIEPCFNEFQLAVLDGLQVAYKVTANSLYGQIGARTSPIYLKDIAACTTATGRKMIMLAKDYLELNYGANVVYGDTDSIFIVFPKAQELDPNPPPYAIKQNGHAAIMPSIQLAIKASSEIKKLLKQPHDLEYEKTFWPFVLISKKRYVGNLYEQDDKKYKTKSMGIVLKRRDNAHIVKKVYGGIIDIILGSQDVVGSIDFLKTELNDLIEGKAPLEDLIITKALRSEYKDPTRIAHKVLAERMGERDPGNKPQINDRIPYVYVAQPPPLPGIPKCRQPKILQGERIEHPDYIRENKLVPDYGFYISNQIMKPVTQIYAIVADQIGLRSKDEYAAIYEEFVKMCEGNASKAKDKLEALREKDVKALLFDPYLKRIEEAINGGPVPEKKTRAQKFPLMLPSSEPILVDGVPLPQDILPVKKTTARKKTATKTLVMDEETGIAEYKEAEQVPTNKPTAKKAPAKMLVMNEETGITEYKTSEPQPSNQEGVSTSKAKTPAPRKTPAKTLVMNEETGIAEYKDTIEQPKTKAPAKKKAPPKSKQDETVNISEVTKIKTEEEMPIIKIKPRKPKNPPPASST